MDVFYKNFFIFAFIGVLFGFVGFLPLGVLAPIISFLGIAFLIIVLILIKKRVLFLQKSFEVKTAGFSALAENLPDGVIVYDPDFRVLAINAAAEKILNVSKKEVEGKKTQPKNEGGRTDVFLQVLFPSIAQSATQISEENLWPRIVEITTKEKRLITTLSRVLREDGSVSYFIKVVRDATGERQVAEDKNEFINVTAHQLRTPLTSLNWALESILKESRGTSETITSVAAEALQVSERTLKIVNDLLDAAKLDEGAATTPLQKTELAPFLRTIIQNSEGFAKERSVSLSFLPVPPEWEGASAHINTQQLGIACGNLIDNAIKYNTKNGTVTMRLEVFFDRKIAKISIEDTGIGMTKKDQDQLFKKFFRGTKVETIEPNGSGLGLYIVKKIVEQHGGKIEVSSREGRGSLFSITLPLSEE